MYNLYRKPGMHTEDHGYVAREGKMLVWVSHSLGRCGAKVSSHGFHYSYTALNAHPVHIFPDCIHPNPHMQPGNHHLRPQRPPGPVAGAHRPGLGASSTE